MSEEKATFEPPLEYSAVALALSEPGAIAFFKDHLSVDAMSRNGRGHKEIYEALLAFHKATGADPIDVTGFRSWLENETEIYQALGGPEGVTTYLEAVQAVKPSTPQSTAALLRYRANRKEQSTLAESLVEALYKPLVRPDEISKLTTDIQRLSYSDERVLDRVVTAESIADHADELWDLPTFLPTPFPSLNRALSYSEENGGICRSTVSAILAASGQGKSTFAKSLMVHWLEQGLKVLYINFEEAEQHWDRVLFTQVTHRNIYKKESYAPELRSTLTKRFKAKMAEWGSRLMVEHNPETQYYEDLEEWIRAIHYSKPEMSPDVIIIDTIQSMFLRQGHNLPRWGQYEIMMVKLEKLAKDLDAAIIITAQENSNRMKERREVVQQSDAGGSLSIIQKSSVTIFITRSKADDSQDDTIMQLQIPKNRITGMVYVMDAPLVKYNDNTKSFEAFEITPIMASNHYSEEYREDLGNFV